MPDRSWLWMLMTGLLFQVVQGGTPFFKQDIGNLVLLENTPIGTTVGRLIANDFTNSRTRVVYSLESDKFVIMNANTGDVILLKPLDREANTGGIPVTLSATFFDVNPPEKIDKRVIVQIGDVNDEFPEFTQKDFKIQVFENTPVGTTIQKNIEVKDVDTTNALLVVTCVAAKAEIADSCDVFNVQMITHTNQDWYGNIVLMKPLDFEKQPLYQLPLEAFDGVNTLSQTFEILVLDVQDTPPKFNGTYSVVVNEGIPIGSYIITVNAEDQDRGVPRPVIYEITKNVGPGAGWFTIDKYTGVISTTVVLDRGDPLLIDGYVEITVMAREVIDAVNNLYGQTDIDSFASAVTINVLDLNDHAPTWLIGTPRVDVREDITAGRPIPGLLATVVDLDQGDKAFHVITQLDYTDTFGFNPTNGTGQTIVSFTVLKPLDFEAFNGLTPEYIIRMVAMETLTVERRSSTATVTIVVTDVNDNTPSFTQSGNYLISVPEDTPIGTSVLKVDATDRDSGLLGKAGIRYSLIGNGAEKFVLDPITGVLTIADCSPSHPGQGSCIDYEQDQLYLLTVLAVDELGKGRRDSRGLVVTVLDANDNRPYCLLDKYTGYIREGETTPNPPLTIIAKDIDSAYNNNNLIFYSIISQPNYVISSSGTISSIRPVTLDQTGINVVNIDVLVRDNIGGVVCHAVLNILDVNDHYPIFTSNGFYNVSIYETSPPGTSVVQVEATDNDPPTSANGQLSGYRIDTGALGKFRIDSVTGLIQVADGATFDYDVQKQYSLTVIAPDKGTPQLTGTAYVEVNILDTNNKSPVFTPNVQRIFVWENTTVGSSIITLKAADPDPGAVLQFSFIEPITALGSQRQTINATSYDFKTLFQINSTTALVTLARPLDYSKTTEITYTAQARDTSATNLQVGSATLIISVLDINNEAPTFARPWTLAAPNYTITVKEEQPVPSFVMTVVATDSESAISGYILSSNPGVYFDISRLTGVVQSIKRLDYEQIQSLDFQVTAYDFGVPVLSATANVHVIIQNINDMTPQFNESGYVATIYENSPGGTYVTTVQAQDGDAGDYGIVSYAINGLSDQFQINAQTGVVTVKAGAILDRELTPDITISVLAEDSPNDASVRNRNSVPVYITLLDVNDNIPQFINTNYFAEIIENIPVTTSVLKVEATDGDSSCQCPNAQLAYTKVPGGDTPGYFSVSRTTGLISVAQSVMAQDYDHKFVVQVADMDGLGPFPQYANVTIRVIKSNNKPPIWVFPEDNNMTIDVLENQYLGMVIYQVKAVDPEGGDRGFVSYHFLYNNVYVTSTPEFTINEITGIIHAGIVYDREAVSLYRLYVVASDSGNPPFNSTRIITVRVRDVDDNKPEFPKGADGFVEPYRFSVQENAPNGTVVGQVQASDRDSPEYGQIYYSIISGNEAGRFRIETKNNTGIIYTNQIIDRETMGSYTLSIRASNNASEQYLVTRRKRAIDPSAVTVTIAIGDLNDNIPNFVNKLYQTCVSSDDYFGKSLVTVSAVDADTGESGIIWYSVTTVQNTAAGSNPISTAFVIGLMNGTLYSNSLFTKYQDTYFNVTVQASNPNSPPGNVSTTMVQVFVTDPLDMVKVVANRGPDEVRRDITDYIKTLSVATNGGVICIDDIRYHLGVAVEIDRSDIFLHIIDKNSKKSMMASDTANVITAAKQGQYSADFYMLQIDSATVVQTGVETVDYNPVFIIFVIVVIIVFIALVLLCCACFFIRRSYKSEMERAKYIHEVPYADHGGSVNPLWQQKANESKSSQGYHNKAYVDDEVDVPKPAAQ